MDSCRKMLPSPKPAKRPASPSSARRLRSCASSAWHTARALAREQGVPMLEGTDLLESIGDALAAAARVGYPVMLKSTAGGGIGMRVCRSDAELGDAFEAVRAWARTTSAMPASSSKSTSSAPGIWKCRSSAMAGAR
jgi:biotin carboxylase